jgi:hypothetical protein
MMCDEEKPGKAIDYRNEYAKIYGPGPYQCHFCHGSITPVGKHVIHHLDGDHDNNDPSNWVPAHKDHHDEYHGFGKVCHPGIQRGFAWTLEQLEIVIRERFLVPGNRSLGVKELGRILKEKYSKANLGSCDRPITAAERALAGKPVNAGKQSKGAMKRVVQAMVNTGVIGVTYAKTLRFGQYPIGDKGLGIDKGPLLDE